jgi:dihydrolipoamide dehydrogenase
VSETEFDLVVIGAGPGGYVAALRAVELGMKVACVDKAALGGTCLNVGCIPSKALLESSERFHEMTTGKLEDHGVRLGEVQLDLAAMMARKERIVQGMTAGIGGLFKKHKVSFFAGTGSIPEPGVVQVTGNGDVALSAANILLALGSEPVELADLPFDGRYILSSTEALELPQVPERMVVIGAGAIGLELGSVWNRLGSEVVVVEFMDSILPGMDGDISTQLQRVLKRQGLDFQLQTRATGANIEDGGVSLSLAGEEAGESVIDCDCVLVAVGRRPYSALSGIQDLGINTDARGFVTVDERYQTSVAGVYAIGDLIPGPMLAHKAEAEGIAAVEIISGKASPLNYGAVPSVVYTDPEAASVGLTEEEARASGRPIQVGKFQFKANARAHCMDAVDGFAKLIADADTDRLLGMHILGPQASHLIAEGVLAIEFAASAEDIARTIHAHPSLSEVVKEAAWAIPQR